MSRTTRSPIGYVFACVLAMAIAPGWTVAQEPPDEAAIQQRRQNLISQMWWNQTQKIETLGLSQEQRTRMDASLQGFLEGRPDGRREQREAFESLGKSLGDGEAEAARSHRDDLAKTFSDPIRAQVDMMIEVVSILTPEQREKLVTLHPRLFSGLWIRSGTPRSLMSRGRPKNAR